MQAINGKLSEHRAGRTAARIWRLREGWDVEQGVDAWRRRFAVSTKCYHRGERNDESTKDRACKTAQPDRVAPG